MEVEAEKLSLPARLPATSSGSVRGSQSPASAIAAVGIMKQSISAARMIQRFFFVFVIVVYSFHLIIMVVGFEKWLALFSVDCLMAKASPSFTILNREGFTSAQAGFRAAFFRHVRYASKKPP